MYSSVFGLFFWIDFYLLICSCNDLSCIYCDCSFFCRSLILLILLVSLTTPICLSTFSNNFPLLTTSLRDPVRLVKQNLCNFWEWVPNSNCFFMFLSNFLKVHLSAIDLRRLQNQGWIQGVGQGDWSPPKI